MIRKNNEILYQDVQVVVSDENEATLWNRSKKESQLFKNSNLNKMMNCVSL